MNPRSLIIVLLVLIGLSALAWLWYKHTRPVPHDFGAPAQEATSTPSVGSLDEHATYYDITATYPATTPLSSLSQAGPNANAVDAMRKFEVDAVAQFKKDGNFANLTHDDVQMLGLDQNKETLDITYTMTTGAHTISYVFTSVSYTLGAHSNTTYKTFTFSTDTGNQLSLSDLFTGTQYLQALSTATRSALPAVIAKNEGVAIADVDTQMLDSGTAPTQENFADWYIDGANITFLFAPYQVAPYAAGTQTLALPLSSIGAKI